jgi:Ca-activated chloride channel family protein
MILKVKKNPSFRREVLSFDYDFLFTRCETKIIKMQTNSIMKNTKITFQYILMTFLLLGNFAAFSQTIHKHLRSGDESYYRESYGESEEAYRKALQQDTNSVNANYNLGNVLYQQERFNEAVNYYAEAVENANNETQKAKAYHNLGNANIAQLESLKDNPQQQQEALTQGVEAYKNALKINPDDKATKYNLAYAQRLMQQMQQNPPPQPQNGEGEQQEQEQPENQDENQENQPKEKQEPNPNEDEQKKQEPKPKPGEMTKEEAERLLKIMEEEERKVQSRMNKEKAKANPKSKDW